jgi:hypothetical protein
MHQICGQLKPDPDSFLTPETAIPWHWHLGNKTRVSLGFINFRADPSKDVAHQGEILLNCHLIIVVAPASELYS